MLGSLAAQSPEKTRISKMKFVGRSGNKVLFSLEKRAAVIDESTNTVFVVDSLPVLASSGYWSLDLDTPSDTSFELAYAALTELDIAVLSDNQRMYTIPKSVQEEAKRALEWRKEHKRGGTPVGINTARTLAKGGQIGIRKIRHIAKYFPRHEVDKKGKGYKPGQDGYPSRGRIAWALWGGDAAQSWSIAIVERENKKENSTIVASHGYYEIEDPSYVDVKSFDFDQCKYMARIRLDGSGIDRLYCIDPLGYVSVWDGGSWDNLGHVDHDIDTYDKSLDDPYDSVEKNHIPIDQESALRLAALFDGDPFSFRKVDEIDPQGTFVYEEAAPYMDFSNLNALVAAKKFVTDRDGNYTPEERSEKATSQLRDKLGRFAVTGSKVVIGGNSNYRGEIVSQDSASQTVKVKLNDGKFIDIPSNQTQQEDTFDGPAPEPATAVEEADEVKNVDSVDQIQQEEISSVSQKPDLTGILSEPRVAAQEKIVIPQKVKPLSKEGLQELLNDYPSWVSSQRNKDSQGQVDQIEEQESDTDIFYEEEGFDWSQHRNALNDPSLNDFVKNPEDSSSRNGLVSSAELEEKEFKNPNQSDVAPIYMAIVADDDPQAVMDLVALIPKGPNTTAPMTFKRDPGQWVADENILKDLNSATPPPVVPLNNELLESVIKQVDGPEIAAKKQMEKQEQAITASSVFYSNQNKVANFHKYWTSGAGSYNIRWKSDGDWSRCVQSLSKHMGPRAKEYCSLRFMDQTSSWPGDLDLFDSSIDPIVASLEVLDNTSLPTSKDIISFAKNTAKYNNAVSRVLTAGGDPTKEIKSNGSGFFIPLVIPEDVESGDGRIFNKDSISIRELPLPLLWQIKTGEGHSGSVVIGKIIKMERTDQGIGNAYGVFDSGAYGSEAERLVRGGFIRGVSADLDKFEADEEVPETGAEGEEGKISSGRIQIKKARVMAVTLVPKPAFQECQIKMQETMETQEEQVVPDGVYVDDVDALEASALVACGIVAGVIPTTPPADWFNNPALKQATPLTVDDDGRVFGHIAAWHVDHIGMSFGTKPPRSRSKYAYFHTGVVRTEEGNDVPVGQLTLAGGHASLELNAQEAVRHYDDTASAIADVHAGEDAYGIWVAGALRPGTSPEQVRALRASAPSGDWRPIKGQLELVAVCQVNVPGFPIARARVASGAVMALVAAGATTLARMKSDPVSDLKQRIAKLEEKENAPLVAAMETARARVLAAKAEELSARVNKVKKKSEKDYEYIIYGVDDGDTNDELAVISRRVRKRLAGEGKALPDGSYPIRNEFDLKNAIQAYGRASAGKKAKVRQHIVKRARALKRTNLVPQNWKEASVDEIPEEGILAAKENPCWDGYVIVGMKTVDGKEVPNCVPKDSAGVAYDVNGESEGVDSPKALRESEENIALPDGSYRIANESDLFRAIWAYGRWSKRKNIVAKDHIISRAIALGREDMLPEIWPGSSNSSEDEISFSLRERIAIKESMIAAGGLDRNRGNAARLRRYWTKGVGAAKIRWGTPGDWRRCVRYLSKHMGVRAKGYCQLRHKEATGVYTGSKLNPGRRKGRNNSVFSAFSEAEFGIFESLYGDPQDYTTEVSDFDMMMPVDKIMEEKDNLYDVLWEPDQDIKILIKKCGYLPSGSYVVDSLENDLEYDMDDMDDIDASVEGYDDDGLLASKDQFEVNEEVWVEDPVLDDSFDDARFKRDENYEPAAPEDSDDIEDIAEEVIDAEIEKYKGLKVKRKGKYTADTQPRDTAGRFRTVLARLKVDLGNVGSDRALDKIEEIENLDYAGDYGKAVKAADDLIGIVDRLDDGALNPEAIGGIREGSRELGRVISNLPFAFGEQAQKLRFSDLPPALRGLIEDMITRVEAKIGKEDADIATKDLRSMMSGQKLYSQSDISSQMAKMLRLLT